MPDTQFENGRLRFVTDPSRRAEDCLAFLDLLRRTMLEFEIEGDNVAIDSTMLRLPGVGINTSTNRVYISNLVDNTVSVITRR